MLFSQMAVDFELSVGLCRLYFYSECLLLLPGKDYISNLAMCLASANEM